MPSHWMPIMFAAPMQKSSGRALQLMPIAMPNSRTPALGASPKIRVAIRHDIPALVEIAAGSREAAAWSEEAYTKSIGRPEFLCLVSECGETIGGFLIARRINAEG